MVAKNNASCNCLINSSLGILIFFTSALYNLLAKILCSFNAEMFRTITAISIAGIGSPESSAASDVHLPVPFAPALSKILSISIASLLSSFFKKISAVISNKKDFISPLFHSKKTLCNSSLSNPIPLCNTS